VCKGEGVGGGNGEGSGVVGLPPTICRISRGGHSAGVGPKPGRKSSNSSGIGDGRYNVYILS
jgi:hypothetical protein